jgi:arylformamidase
MGATHHRLTYGALPTQGIDLYRPANRASPLVVFIHGGYWQELSAKDSRFAAASFLREGIAFAAVDYTLAPAASVANIVGECRLAFRTLASAAPKLGIDASSIVVVGSSAGAHLAAMVALGERSSAPRASVLLSGVFDLAPLVHTSINGALGLQAATAKALSPWHAKLDGMGPTLVTWGDVETHAFKTQSMDFAAALVHAGVPCTAAQTRARNHFDLPFDLCDRDSLTRRWIDAMLRLN